MHVPFTVVFEPPTRLEVRRFLTSRGFGLTLLAVVFGTLGAFFLIAYLRARQHPRLATATVHVTTTPPGASVELDGQRKGQTPLTVAITPGTHQVALRLNGYATTTSRVTAENGQTVSVHRLLWLAQPRLLQIRPPLPGSEITGAAFLADGRIALMVALPPSNERQLWLTDGHSEGQRVGPPKVTAPMAVSADGQRVAYVVQSGASSFQATPSELWVAPSSGGSTGQKIYTAEHADQPERFVDVSWSPDGAHLLLASQRQLSAGAGLRTRLLSLSAEGGDPRELAVLPSQVVPGSFVWGPQGQVAFLTTNGQVTSLCVLDSASGGVRYVADLSWASNDPTQLPPIAWSNAGDAIYSAPLALRKSEIDRLLSGPAVYGLFMLPAAATTGKAFGAEGQFPVWRPDGSLVVFGKPNKGSGLTLRLISSSGPPQDLATLPFSGQLAGVRWDADRAQALLALRASTDAGSQTDYWLATFAPKAAQ